jgi:hypothetical protein
MVPSFWKLWRYNRVCSSVHEGKPMGYSVSPWQGFLCFISVFQIFSRSTCPRRGNIWQLVLCPTSQVQRHKQTLRSHHSCVCSVATFLASIDPLGTLSLASHTGQISSDTNIWSWKVTKYISLNIRNHIFLLNLNWYCRDTISTRCLWVKQPLLNLLLLHRITTIIIQ